MKFWTIFPYALLFVAGLQIIYPAQHVTLSDIEVDIVLALAIILLAIDNRRRP